MAPPKPDFVTEEMEQAVKDFHTKASKLSSAELIVEIENHMKIRKGVRPIGKLAEIF